MSSGNTYQLTDLIAPSFYKLHHQIKDPSNSEFILRGGRGSTKSSFIAIQIVLGMMRDAENGVHSNAAIFMQVKSECNGAVKPQIEWAIHALGVADKWEIPEAKLEITYKATGQKIRFRGMDKAKKTKGLKCAKGWFKYIWYEELDLFRGMEDIRTSNQSLMRGGPEFKIFYSYNPPKSARSWVNKFASTPKSGTIVHHSDYLNVPSKWLGEKFIAEAEHLKKTNLAEYQNEYLGYETGTGLEVFNNLTIRTITDAEIAFFDNIRQGIDFGYAADPVNFERIHLDSKRKKIFFIDEFSGINVSNIKLFENIKQYRATLTTCDSAEPKSIADLKSYGMRVRGAKKGPDSIEYGIKFISTMEEIIIDPSRTPRAYSEFLNYALQKDANGEIKNGYPDKNNHSIDTVRYALENDMRSNRPGLNGVIIGARK